MAEKSPYHKECTETQPDQDLVLHSKTQYQVLALEHSMGLISLRSL